ncbi:GNAT family N-acetyltransferase [Denitromonas halophila]|uniref:GNAT family N-acetyltransferase n=1 Tax=Denitromonas halophila TaxID=1629404 RepID=UPI0037045B8E
MEEKTSGRVLGAAGPVASQRLVEPEIKWALSRAHWRQGFASEAVRLVGARFEKDVECRRGAGHLYRHPKDTPANLRSRPLCPRKLSLAPPMPSWFDGIAQSAAFSWALLSARRRWSGVYRRCWRGGRPCTLDRCPVSRTRR